MKPNDNKAKIMFVNDKDNIADEINNIKCTLVNMSEIDRRLRSDNRDYIGQIRELNGKNEKVVKDLLLAKQMEKKAKDLRFRDVGILLSMFAAFAMFVTYVSL